MEKLRLTVALFAFALLGGAQAAFAQKDVTSTYIKNADLSSVTDNKPTDWTATNFENVTTNTGYGNVITAFTVYLKLDVTSYSLTQDVKLPAGSYTLVNYSLFRQGTSYNDNPTTSKANLVAGSNSAAVMTMSQAVGGDVADAGVAASAFGQNLGRNTLSFTLAEETTITIGVTGTFDAVNSWLVVGAFKLYDMSEKLASGTDLTGLIANPNFEYSNNRIAGWTNREALTFTGISNNFFTNSGYAQVFDSNGNTGSADIYQTVYLPAGVYQLSASAIARDVTSATLYAGSNTADVVINSINDATINNNTTYNIVFTVAEAGNVSIGYKGVMKGEANNWLAVDNFKLTYLYGDATKEVATITSSTGFATYVTVNAVDFAQAPEGLTAYTAKYDADKSTITLTPVTTAVPANTPLVLHGTAGTYALTTAASGTAPTDNDLQYTASAVTTTAEGNYWCLTEENESAGFAPVASNVIIPARKAYLNIGGNTAKFLPFADTVTGINAVGDSHKSRAAQGVYNLAGQRVGNSYKGIVIVNGRKVVVK